MTGRGVKLLRWHLAFWRDFGWREYLRVVVRDAWVYRAHQFPKVATCLLTRHSWEYHSVNVAPEVATGATGGYNECKRCHHVRGLWGYV